MYKRVFLLAIFAAAGLCSPAVRAQQNKALEVYFVDVEGGQSTLFVSPGGQSLLVDTGWPGGRDSGRIAAVAKTAGVSQIDYLVITHYHGDHAGGVVDLASKIPIRNFVDHGPSQEETRNVPQMYSAYLSVREKGQHILAKPGDKLPVRGLDIQIISAAAETIAKPLPGAGAPNPACANFVPKDEVADTGLGGENKQSVGMVVSLGKFRLADFGDLTWNKERDLACPNNLIGTIDVYVVSHHGQDISSLPMLVHAMHPRVAIMDNGAKKGGAVATFETLKTSPGLEDLWQLHYAVDAGDHNMPEKFIANQGVGGTAATGVPDEPPANYIQLTARPDGSFTVKNSRNGYLKDYAAKK
ncbi:MAG TPA: MBL fold metallo-hydrolase [Candidatus Acidoferrales bacterium]|nr:MBL fold metallo-hydrolase [Candidatus Acidoferrales bacterium]